jgi:hypothetical protein
MKARIQAGAQIDAVILAAPELVRSQFRKLSPRQRIRAAATMRPGQLYDPAAATKAALRALARRWQALQLRSMTSIPSSPRWSPPWPLSWSPCPEWASTPPGSC